MSSVSTVTSGETSPSTATSAAAPRDRAKGPFSRMLASTLASFAGTGDPVRHRAAQASRTWQTQRQLGQQFAPGKNRAAVEADGADRLERGSRADRLRDQQKDNDMHGPGDDPHRHQAETADRAAEARERTLREPHRSEARTSSTPRSDETHVAADQKVRGIREQRTGEAQRQSSPVAGTRPEEPGSASPAPARVEPADAPKNAGNEARSAAQTAARQASAAPNASQTSASQQNAKPATATARIEGVQQIAKSTTTVAKGSTTSTDVQNILNEAGGKKSQSDAAKAGGKLDRTATPQTQRGIDITRAKAMQELASIVRARVNARESTIQLRLDPPELGKVQIDLNMKQDVLTLRIETQTQAGHDALQARLIELRHALEQHGITINRVEVELSPPSPSTHDTNTASQHQPHNPAAQDDQASQQFSPDGSNQGHDGSRAPGGSPPDPQRNEAYDAGPSSGATDDMEYGELPSLAETGLDLVV